MVVRQSKLKSIDSLLLKPRNLMKHQDALTPTSDSPQHQARTARWLRSELAVLAVTAIYMLIALVAAAVTGKLEFVFYLGVMLILIALVLLLHRRIHLPMPALWALSLWGLLHMSGGLLQIPESWPRHGDGNVLYNWWLWPGMLKFDQLVHAYGFGLVTWITWVVIKALFEEVGFRLKPTLGLMILCVAVGMGMGAANEVVEFAATLTLPQTNVGGYENTGWDLVSNLIGCLIASALIYRLDRKS